MSRRSRERREAREAKADPAVVAPVYIGLSCSDAVWCRTNGRLCDGECESYDAETPDA